MAQATAANAIIHLIDLSGCGDLHRLQEYLMTRLGFSLGVGCLAEVHDPRNDRRYIARMPSLSPGSSKPTPSMPAREDIRRASVTTPVGRLGLVQSGESIVRLEWESPHREASTPLLEEAISQLRAYFDGRLESFELPLRPAGSVFQRRVCEAMLAIPFGETRTYGWIASRLDSSPQPVGNACGANSIPILVPCHRVLGASGLGGYSGRGGTVTKATLLRHENAYPYLF